mmetsp:Transcript_150106/g.262153  ORF Transcript_150106/g.262153 Transcript_150106/m.262153 type:complete len:200 (+) Transcript_150106:2496-3095(+)
MRAVPSPSMTSVEPIHDLVHNCINPQQRKHPFLQGGGCQAEILTDQGLGLRKKGIHTVLQGGGDRPGPRAAHAEMGMCSGRHVGPCVQGCLILSVISHQPPVVADDGRSVRLQLVDPFAGRHPSHSAFECGKTLANGDNSLCTDEAPTHPQLHKHSCHHDQGRDWGVWRRWGRLRLQGRRGRRLRAPQRVQLEVQRCEK